MNDIDSMRHMAFDAAFAARADDLRCRPRCPDDVDFLIHCAIACSPLAGMLPDAMIAQQAAFQRAGHDGAHPDAMHRIVLRGGMAVGHILVAWGAGSTHLVDIAVLPGFQGAGAGSQMLGAWLDVADTYRLTATLEVRADNPARRLYARLGFVETDVDPWALIIDLHRPPNQR